MGLSHETGNDDADLNALPAAARADVARAHHYGEFYGLKPVPDDGRPLLLVLGNCQAESTRLLVQDAPGAPCRSVRLPAVHEIAADEMPFLDRLLRRCDVILTQPVKSGFHGLALGTDDLRRTAPHAQVVVFPIIRFVGLYPYQMVTASAALRPPVVPYHDLRTILRAAGLPPAPPLDAPHLEAVTQWSLRILRQREQRAGAVPVHDLIPPTRTRAANTVNHPGNPVLGGLAQRIQATLGWPETAGDPGFELLDSVYAPLESAVRDVVDPGAGVRADWLVDGRRVPDAAVAEAQLAWYRERPQVVATLLERGAEQLSCLGVDQISPRES